MLLLILVVCAVSLLIYLKIIQPMNYWRSRGVPYIKPYPIIGNLGPILFRKKHISDFFKDLLEFHPNERYVGMYSIMQQPSIVLNDPDLVTQICVKEFNSFPNHATTVSKEADSFLAGVLMNLEGKEWKEMRSTLSPVFTSSKMKAMYPLIQECAENLTNHFLEQNLENGKSLEMEEVFSKFSNDVIASVAFGVKCNSFQDPNNPFYLTGKNIMNILPSIKTFLAVVLPKLGKLLRLKVFPSKVTKFFKDIVKENMLEREKHNIIRPDLIHLLMEAKRGNLKHEVSATNTTKEEGFAVVEESDIGKEQSTKKVLTDDDYACQAMLFFFAGFGTVSITSCFMAHELAVNPDVQKKLQDEIDSVYDKTDLISYEQLFKMKFLDQVVTETLRLWAPSPQADRRSTKSFTIQPVRPDEKPLVLEKGFPITIPIIAFHRSPDFFPNPDKFDPDRFSDENKHNIKSNAFMPFGVGPRNCIGSRLALLEVKTLFVNLLRKFNIVVVKDTVIPIKLNPKTLSMVPIGGFWFGLQPRKCE